MPALSSHPFLIVVVTAFSILVLVWTGQIWARRQVTRWSQREGYELVTFRGAWFFEGPRRWVRTDTEHAYHVEVRDRYSMTREGYVLFGTWWNPFSGKVRVEWD